MKLYSNLELSSDDYHANRTHKSSSVLKSFLHDSRAYYAKYVLNKDQGPKTNPNLIQGSHIHTCILEPHLVDTEYAVYPGAMKKGAAWEKFAEKNANKTILTNTQNQLSQKLIRNFNDTTVVIGAFGKEEIVNLNTFFIDGFAEESIFGELDGMKIKVRFDYRRDFEEFGSINDLKTTADIITTVSHARAICERMDYDLSAALYVDMAELYFKKKYYFYFTFLSKTDGRSTIFKASEAFISRGREKYKKAIKDIQAAELTGNYFSSGIEEL
ncbi:PD-(D/E)XK nuclease-like domain-containing protein [Candidatus Dojkabacteria bacterium]|jgi:hypothetical protein|nr:PD-(D/E)XK nuclease-like domain-containing protein [Candidatus Dojkabacteria bacterium]